MIAGALHALSETGKTSTGEAVLFWCLAPIMVLAGIGLLVVKKAVHAALLVITIMISLAILYIAQGAVFLGMVQVVVYTGAVMMLFLFVLMLVGVDGSDSLVETIRGQRWIALLAGIGLACVLVGVVATAVYDAQGLHARGGATTTPRGSRRSCSGSTCSRSRWSAPCWSPRRWARWSSRTGSGSSRASGRRSVPTPAWPPARPSRRCPHRASTPGTTRWTCRRSDRTAGRSTARSRACCASAARRPTPQEFAARIDRVLAGGSVVAGKQFGNPDGPEAAATEENQ